VMTAIIDGRQMARLDRESKSKQLHLLRPAAALRTLVERPVKPLENFLFSN
jgi:hypothetical protein